MFARTPRKFLATLAIVALATGSFVAGYVVREREQANGRDRAAVARVVNRNASRPAGAQQLDFQIFWDLWTIVQREYLRQPVADDRLLYGALAGMVEHLDDPYSAFFDPEHAKLFRQDLVGQLEGIGAEIGIKEKQLTVIAALPGSPAERAGLRSGDVILTVDGASTTSLTLEGAVARIRGPKGSSVALLLRSRARRAPREVTIVRDVVHIQSVAHRIVTRGGKKIGVLTIAQFNTDAVERVDAAVREFLSEKVSGVVLDLRNDPGGFLQAAVDIAGEWVDRRVVVRERTNDGKITEHRSTGLARFAGMPTVVLVNRGTASAAEILAGALQDYTLGEIMGERTFGKGTVQHLANLRDGSAIKLTIAEWLTPSGRSIERDGIVPDTLVEVPEDTDHAKQDPQLDAAFTALDARMRGGDR
ncbi:S41 family peptidase [Candidatus Uhrbacteria bacterium]|nr:S41 family peptidase [Candidatus Uhrbacteria bacterium]